MLTLQITAACATCDAHLPSARRNHTQQPASFQDRWNVRNQLWLQGGDCHGTAIETAASQAWRDCVGFVRLQGEVNGALQSCVKEDLSYLYNAGWQGHDGLQRRPTGDLHVSASARLFQPG